LEKNESIYFQMFLFVLKGGPLSGDPAAAWATVKDTAPIIPVDGSAATFWQLVFFAAAVLIGFGLGHLLFKAPGNNLFRFGAVQDWLSRMFGALFGALTGATIAAFVLPRRDSIQESFCAGKRTGTPG
jgi:hypothetical protein